MEELFHSGVVTWSRETGRRSTTAIKAIADDLWFTSVIVSLRLIRGHGELQSRCYDWPVRGWDEVSKMLETIAKSFEGAVNMTV